MNWCRWVTCYVNIVSSLTGCLLLITSSERQDRPPSLSSLQVTHRTTHLSSLYSVESVISPQYNMLVLLQFSNSNLLPPTITLKKQWCCFKINLTCGGKGLREGCISHQPLGQHLLVLNCIISSVNVSCIFHTFHIGNFNCFTVRHVCFFAICMCYIAAFVYCLSCRTWCYHRRQSGHRFVSLSQFIIVIYCLSNAMHGQTINLPVCVCRVSVCVCVRHTFCQLAYRSDPSMDFYSW